MSILVFSPNGTHVAKPTLEAARTSADCAGKTVVVTSVLTAAQSDITAAWPVDRALRVEKGGSIANTSTFTVNGEFSAGPHQAFTGTGIIVLSNVGKHYPEWYSSETYTQATIQAALTAIGTVNKVTLLLRPGTWVTSSNADWSAYTNVTFRIPPGAVISHGAFTVNIPNPDAGLYQVFSGTGLVALSGKVSQVYPEWYKGAAEIEDSVSYQKAVNTCATSTVKKIKLSQGTYTFNTAINLTSDSTTNRSGIVVEGDGRRGSTTIRANTGGVLFDTTASPYLRFTGLYIITGLTNPSWVIFFLAQETGNSNLSMYNHFDDITIESYIANATATYPYGTIGYLVIGSEENTWGTTQIYATTPVFITTAYSSVSAYTVYCSPYKHATIEESHSAGVNTFNGENMLVTFDAKGRNLVLFSANTVDLGNIYMGNMNIGAPGAVSEAIYVLGGTLEGLYGHVKIENRDTFIHLEESEALGWDLHFTLGAGIATGVPAIQQTFTGGSVQKFNDIKISLTYYDPSLFAGKKIFDTLGTTTQIPVVSNVHITTNMTKSQYGINSPIPYWFNGYAKNVQIDFSDYVYKLDGAHHQIKNTGVVALGAGNNATPTSVGQIYLPAIVASYSASAVYCKAKGLLTTLYPGNGGSENAVTAVYFETGAMAYSQNNGAIVVPSASTSANNISNTGVSVSNDSGSFLFTDPKLTLTYDAVTRVVSVSIIPNGSGASIAAVNAYIYDLELDVIVAQPSNRLTFIR